MVNSCLSLRSSSTIDPQIARISYNHISIGLSDTDGSEIVELHTLIRRGRQRVGELRDDGCRLDTDRQMMEGLCWNEKRAHFYMKYMSNYVGDYVSVCKLLLANSDVAGFYFVFVGTWCSSSSRPYTYVYIYILCSANLWYCWTSRVKRAHHVELNETYISRVRATFVSCVFLTSCPCLLWSLYGGEFVRARGRGWATLAAKQGFWFVRIYPYMPKFLRIRTNLSAYVPIYSYIRLMRVYVGYLSVYAQIYQYIHICPYIQGYLSAYSQVYPNNHRCIRIFYYYFII